MSVDLTGGIDAEREFLWANQPSDPNLRESVNAWLWADDGAVGVPRIGIEAIADQWDTHDVQTTVRLPDDRVITCIYPGSVHPAAGADGRPRVLGAGPLRFELLEPFEHWTIQLDGPGTLVTVADQLSGWLPGGPGRPVDVRLDLEVRAAAPPWEPGTLRPEAGRVLATQDEGAVMGGPRYEQLFRSVGSLCVDGETFSLDGGGLRVRRRGVRQMGSFRGHVWQSAVFPDGRAFGHIVYPDRPDGRDTLNEGYLFYADGDLVAAKVVSAPWLGELGREQDVDVVLETADGTTTISGRTTLPSFMSYGPPSGFRIEQSIVSYTWDGLQTFGMLERSTMSA